MTDRELESSIRALYRTRVPTDTDAPIELRSGLAAIAHSPSPGIRFGGSRAIALLAAATLLAAALIGGALVAGSGLLRLTAVVPPTDSPRWHPARPRPQLMGGCLTRAAPRPIPWTAINPTGCTRRPMIRERRARFR
jgi:hypothetical protein